MTSTAKQGMDERGARNGKEKGKEAAFEELLTFIRENRGFDFAGYKRSSLTRRVTKRMEKMGVQSFAEYKDYLEAESAEFIELFNTILINVTKFFRDPQAWEFLEREILPKIIQNKSANQPVRVWSVGCASGEEAYTIAMLLAETLGKEQFRTRAKIYATDVDEEALTQARHATYTPEDLQEVPSELKGKYFDFIANKHVFSKDLRRSIIFGVNDAVQNAPISRLDLLICRNTLMYFTSETQNRILARFHFALNDEGYLFLGRAETMPTRARLFAPANLRHRIFGKVPSTDMRNHALFLAQASAPEYVDS